MKTSTTAIPTPPVPSISEAIERGALFAVNHSGGKDSQAMLAFLRSLGVPDSQIVIVHAHMPDGAGGKLTWKGTFQHVKDTTHGLPIYEAQAVNYTILSYAERRGMFPAPTRRWCTSDMKRGPLWKQIRRASRETGRKLVINCEGLRAEESSDRAAKSPFSYEPEHSKAGRECWTWLPILHWSEAEVFAEIERAGQKPHEAYALGSRRLSCVFCIYSSDHDLKLGAQHNPALYQKYAQLEKKLGHTLMMPKPGQPKRFLPDITGVTVETPTQEQPQ